MIADQTKEIGKNKINSVAESKQQKEKMEQVEKDMKDHINRFFSKIYEKNGASRELLEIEKKIRDLLKN